MNSAVGIWDLAQRLFIRAQRFEKRFALSAQRLFELACAIAIAARPGFAAVFVPTIPSRVRIFDAHEIEIFLPVRSLFSEGRIAETGFHPSRNAVGAEASFAHIIDVFVPRDGSSSGASIVNRLQ